MLELWRKRTLILRTSGAIYPATERNIQEDLNLQHHRWENFKSRKNVSTSLTLVFEICTFIAINYHATSCKSNSLQTFLFIVLWYWTDWSISPNYVHFDWNVCHTEAMGHADCDAVTKKLILSGQARLGVSLKRSENNYYTPSAS